MGERGQFVTGLPKAIDYERVHTIPLAREMIRRSAYWAACARSGFIGVPGASNHRVICALLFGEMADWSAGFPSVQSNGDMRGDPWWTRQGEQAGPLGIMTARRDWGRGWGR
jgi:hypothetical protein